MQSATDREREDQTEGFRLDAFLLPVQFRDDPFRRGFEGESKGLMPPSAPPAAEALVEDKRVVAVSVGVHPGFAAGAEAGGADEADEGEGGEEKEELEGGVD